MKAKESVKLVQTGLLIPPEKQASHIGPITRSQFAKLATLGPDDEFTPPDGAKPDELAKPGEGARDISGRAIDLIQHFESCELKAYKDEAGVWTIGWGHTGLQHKDGTVYPGRAISQEKADQLFRYDMEQFEARVSAFTKGIELNDDEYGALVAFDFNTGKLDSSTLLKRLKAEDRSGAANEFLKWIRAGGKVQNGLIRRRRSERRLFLGRAKAVLENMREVELDKQGKLG